MNKYLSELKKELQLFGNSKKGYFNSFKEQVKKEMSNDTPYEEMVEKYGSPNEVSAAYFEDYDIEEIKRKIKLKKAIILIAIIMCITIFTLVLKSNIEGKNAYIDREVEILEKGE